MDYLVIGSNGLVQIGDSGFSKKLKIEMRVLMDYFHHIFLISQKLKALSYYLVKPPKAP